MAADLLANIVLDSGKGIDELYGGICRNELAGVDVSSMPFLSCSDRASRGNPGEASASAIVVVFAQYREFVVAVESRCIGIQTSSYAEWEAACITPRLLVRWLYASGLLV